MKDLNEKSDENLKDPCPMCRAFPDPSHKFKPKPGETYAKYPAYCAKHACLWTSKPLI